MSIPRLLNTSTDSEAQDNNLGVSTSRAAQVLLLLIAVPVLAARMPTTIETLVRTAPPEVREAVGDPSLVNLSMTVGAVLGLMVTIGSLVIFLALAALLERQLPVATVGRGRLRFGAMTATVATCFVVTQVRDLPALPQLLTHDLAGPTLAAMVGLATGAYFVTRPRRSAPASRRWPVVLGTTGLALATSLTTIPGH